MLPPAAVSERRKIRAVPSPASRPLVKAMRPLRPERTASAGTAAPSTAAATRTDAMERRRVFMAPPSPTTVQATVTARVKAPSKLGRRAYDGPDAAGPRAGRAGRRDGPGAGR